MCLKTTSATIFVRTSVFQQMSDHDYRIATFDELMKMFPCHLQARRDRQMLKRSEHAFVGPEHRCVGPVKDKHAQVHAQYVDIPLTRFVVTADKDRCGDDDVCLGSGSGRDTSHIESHIEGLAEREHDVWSRAEGHDAGSVEVKSNVGSDPSSSSTLRQQQRPNISPNINETRST